jgi:hypothetical protein
MIHDSALRNFNEFCGANALYWSPLGSAVGSRRVILVDLFHDWPEYLLHSLLIGKFLQRLTGARLVGVTGHTSVVRRSCPGFDIGMVRRIAASFQVNEIVCAPDFPIGCESNAPTKRPHWCPLGSGDELARAFVEGEDPACVLRKCTYESTLRACLRASIRHVDTALTESSIEVSFVDQWLGEVFQSADIIGLVTGHIDYNPWRLLCDKTLRGGGDCYYFSLNGGESRCALYKLTATAEPLTAAVTSPGALCRQANARSLLSVYEARGEQLCIDASLHFNRQASGELDFGAVPRRLVTESGLRAAIRKHVCARFGWDCSKPVTTLFAQTCSDTPLSDLQAFMDYEEWMRHVLRIAAGRSARNWLIKVHPLDAKYDATALMVRLAEEYREYPHIRFVHEELSRQEVLSVTDLALSVRGSIGIEAPAAGIPCLLAGHALYSDCGFSQTALDARTFEAALLQGESLVPLSQEAQMRAQAYAYYDVALGALTTTAFDPVGSFFEDPAGFFSRLTRRMRRYHCETDPMLEAVAVLSRSVRSERALMPMGKAAPARYPFVPMADAEARERRARRWDFVSGSADLARLVTGFGRAEPEGTWATAKYAVVWIDQPEKRGGAVSLCITMRILAAHALIVGAGGYTLARFATSSGGFMEYRFDIPNEAFDGGPFMPIWFEADKIFSPLSLGINNDARELLLCLQSLAVDV